MTKRELAISNFNEGMNCAQAVLLAFKDEVGVDEQTLRKIIIGFGGGFARQRLVCGAISGMCAVLGLVKSDGEDKRTIYATIQKACAEAKEKLGSIICEDLLKEAGADKSPTPAERTKEYYEKRPCSEICGIVAEITEKFVK